MGGLPPRVVRRVVGEIGTNCYILASPDGSTAIVVDPGDAGDRIAGELSARKLRLRAVLLTHGHIDHVRGIPALLEAAGPAPVLLHADDRRLWDTMGLQAEFLGVPRPALQASTEEMRDGEVVNEAGWILDIMHTPGHSPGSVSLLLRGHAAVLSGDTVFRRGTGRTDLWGGSWNQLARSIQSRILTLPDNTTVLPGHGETTTVGEFRLWLEDVGLAEAATEPW